MPFPALCRLAIGVVFATAMLRAQQPLSASAAPSAQVDTDRDGLSDALEQRLLVQFEPHFMVGEGDCSIRPAEFRPAMQTPQVIADNGTIYGQAFPAKGTGTGAGTVELHYYHLWRKDCGGHGHPLDTEHVAVLIQPRAPDQPDAAWQALYWYAAAHENTVCDVSQIARAATLAAVDHGATIWISPGKHASYLDGTLCQRGCGADRCEKMVPLAITALINLGEPDHPMNASLFISSAAWPLRAKMVTTNFPAASLARLDHLAADRIAWVNAGRHPAQGIIAHSSSVAASLGDSGQKTTAAMATAEDSTEGSLSTAGDSTGNALDKTYRGTKHALGTSTHHVAQALHLSKKKAAPPAPQ